MGRAALFIGRFRNVRPIKREPTTDDQRIIAEVDSVTAELLATLDQMELRLIADFRKFYPARLTWKPTAALSRRAMTKAVQ
jgi:hypothetical protein